MNLETCPGGMYHQTCLRTQYMVHKREHEILKYVRFVNLDVFRCQFFYRPRDLNTVRP